MKKGHRTGKERHMIAVGPVMWQRLNEVRQRLQACRLLEGRLGLLFPELANRKVPITGAIDWLLTVAAPDLKAAEKRLLLMAEQRYGEPEVDGPPPAA